MIRELAAALLLPFVALAAELVFWPWVEPSVWIFFYPAVFLSAQIGGLPGGIISTLVSVAIGWLILTPMRSTMVSDSPFYGNLILFLFMACLIIIMHERLRRALKSLQSRFDATFDHAAIGVALVSLDGKYISVNRKLCEILGYTVNELLKKTFQEIIAPGYLNISLSMEDCILAGEPSQSIEKQYICKDGSLVWVEVTVSLVRASDGTPGYFITMVQDITKRKLIETALAESATALLDAQRVAGVGNWSRDVKSGEVFWSPETFRAYGRNPELGPEDHTVVANSFTDESWARLAPAIQRCLADGAPYACDVEVVCPEGANRWISIRGEGSRDASGAVVRLHGTVQDITKRKEIEAALKESAAKLEEAQRIAGLGHWSRDLRTNKGVSSSTIFCMLGRDPSLGSAEARDLEKAFTPESWRKLILLTERLKQTGESFECDVAAVTDDGGRRWLSIRGEAHRDATGAVVEMRGTVQDITKRKEIEQALKQSEARLAEAERVAGLGNFERDLRTGKATWSENLYRLYARDAALGPCEYDEIQSYYTRESWARVAAAVEKCLATGEAFGVDAELKPFGGVRWVTIRCEAFSDESGALLRLRGTVQDITKRKLAEEEAWANQAKLEAALASMSDAVCITDTEGRLTHFNEAFATFLRFKEKSECLTLLTDYRAILEVRSGEGVLLPVEEWSIAKALRGETGVGAEHILQRRDSGERWISNCNFAPVRNSSHEIVGSVLTARDVTKRKEIERALQQSEARLKLGVEVAGLSLAETDYERKTCRLSDGAARLLGLKDPLEYLSIKALHSLVHRDDRLRLDEEIKRSFDPEAHGRFEIDLRIVRPDGEVRWVRVREQIFFEGTSDCRRATCGIVVASDITAEKTVEEAVRRSEEFLRGVLDSLPQEIAVLDASGLIIAVNEAWERFGEANGLAEATHIGANYLDACISAAEGGNPHAQKAFEGLKTLLSGERSAFTLEFPRDAANGRRWFVTHAARAIHVSASVVVSHTDITGRRRAEYALAESEQRLQLFIEHAPAALAMFDRDMRYLAVSRRWKEDYGIGERDIIGLSHYEIFPDMPAQWKTAHARGLAGEVVEANEDSFVRADGTVGWGRWELRPWRKGGGDVGGIVIFSEDITKLHIAKEEVLHLNADLERRVIERTTELAEARKKADAANAAKSAFLANMSHEIRTPMNAILGFTRLLRRDATSVQQIERLGNIDRAGRHLLSVINDVLDLSKIEAGHLRLEQRSFDLGQVLCDVASLIAGPARSKSLRLSIDTDHMPVRVYGDDTRLRQALLNYANNAVKFTESGFIVLRTKLLCERDDQLMTRFEVEDTGIGVDTEILPKLFNAFEQADVSTTRKFGGTGLGLAITRRLAELMGGEAGGRSQPGVGSTFWFTARLSKADSTAVAHVQAAVARRTLRRGARILLAEDNVINREVAVELLRGLDLAVDTARDGREVLVKARAGDYDLVLMDVQMPEVDGIEATRRLRALPGWLSKPIVAMTANVFEEDRQACLDAGMSDFVGKPVDPDQLYEVLAHWLPAPARDLAIPREGEDFQWSSIPGLDCEQGLKRMNGSLAGYQRLLRIFADDQADAVERLRAKLRAGDKREATRIAHTLKGAAGSLGATWVQASAARAEAAVRDGVDAAEIEIAIDALTEETHALMTAIRASLPPRTVVEPCGEPDWAALRQSLDELEALLVSGDVRANDIVEANAAQVKFAFGADAEALLRRIDQYQYPEALDILKRARADNEKLRD
jgi:two-component system, sensor histidine kinase and response regulator